MGCSGSRMGGAVEDDVPARIRPLLRRRLEEMKKRSQASVLKGNQTLSKKELLRHGGGGSDGEETEHEGSMRSAKVAPAPDHDEVNNKEVVYEEVVEKVIEVVKEHDDDDDFDDDHHEEDEEEERTSNLDERMICPGSPSFRVYCIDLSDSDNESEDKYREEKKKPSEKENSTIVVDPKDQSNKRVKKARKGRRFGIAMPKATMPKKYLFNVTAPCYSAAAGGCMGNHHSRIVQEKSSSTN